MKSNIIPFPRSLGGGPSSPVSFHVGAFALPLALAIAAIGFGNPCLAKAQAQPAAASPAVPATSGAPAPKIQFDSATFEFGKVSAGDFVKHTFVFTNTGTAELEITAVQPACGCTTAGTWDKKVEPGKTGSIPLQFNSANFSGTISKYATVTCNDPTSPSIVLHINGTVWKPIEITPPMAIFNVFSDEKTNQTKIMRIVNNRDDLVNVSDAHSSNPGFETELKTIRPGKEFELVVTALGPFTSRTAYATITLKTSSTNTPTLTATAYVMVQQSVMAVPDQLRAPAGPLASPLTQTVSVRNNSSNTLVLAEAKFSMPGVDVKVRETQPGRLFYLDVVFPVGFVLKPDQTAELTVKTDNPRVPVLHIPVYAAPAQAPPAAARPGLPSSPASASPTPRADGGSK